MYRCLVRLCDAERDLRDGDLLLFRRRGLISIAGRGVLSLQTWSQRLGLDYDQEQKNRRLHAGEQGSGV